MTALRSVLFAFAFYGGTVLYIVGGALVVPLGARPVRAVANACARYHRRCARVLLGIRTRVEGSVPQEPVLVASKHQSMFETLDLVVILRNPAIVMKRELARIPLFGAITNRYGIIAIDREGGAASLRRLLKAAQGAVDEGRPIVIFPEGTRVEVGEQPPLQPGFAGLYSALKLPVVPVALDSGRIYPRRGFLKRSGVVTIRFGEPIPPGLPRREAEARVHAAINALDAPAA